VNKLKIISNTVEFAKKTLEKSEGGHDWFHAQRVWNNTILIANLEEVDSFVVELGALLHDIADSKFYNGDETVGPRMARNFLIEQKVTEEIITHVEQIIKNISFKGGNFEGIFNSPELNVVQDADRLDAIGAIGIARCFNYGGFKNRPMYNPEILPKMNMSKSEYKESKSPSINHFYEKLLLLKDKMNTKAGRQIAEERHNFMLRYLQQFYDEWNGNMNSINNPNQRDTIHKSK
jgi:uncharacterized protein